MIENAVFVVLEIILESVDSVDFSTNRHIIATHGHLWYLVRLCISSLEMLLRLASLCPTRNPIPSATL